MDRVAEFKKMYEGAMGRVSEMMGKVATTDTLPTGLIYLSHPFGGLKDNMFDAGQIANRLQRELGTDGTILSPIHNFSWLAYREETSGYWEDIYHCIRLLSSCDGMILSGDWRKSQGCCIEYLYCLHNNIPVYEYVEK